MFRRKPVHAVALMAIGIFLLTMIAASTSQLGSFSFIHAMPIWNLPDLLLPIVVPAFASGSFAREHEQRTWDDVLLTRLGAWEIIRGKFLGALLPTTVAIIVIFPALVMLLMVWGVTWALDFGPWVWITAFKFLISAFFYISLVMVCSYFSNYGKTALVASYVLLAGYALANFIVWVVLMPSLYDLFIGVDPDSTMYRAAHDSFSPDAGRQFTLSPLEIAHTIQALVLGMLCLRFLRWRLGRRG
jgi:ABC-type transport system involved in multi-copper enzyme maturation permease subunit